MAIQSVAPATAFTLWLRQLRCHPHLRREEDHDRRTTYKSRTLLGDLTAHLADVVSGEDFESLLHGRLL
jgi:hypothetical protein